MDSDPPEASPQAAPGAPAASAEELVKARLFLLRLQKRRPVVTYTLLVLIAAVFGLEQLWGGGSTATLVRMGAEVPSRIRAGEWWRLLAPTFLHSGIPHVLMNGAVLFMLGAFVERLLGSARFLILYVVSGLLGSVFGVLFSSWSKFELSVGASGALFGLLGASAVLGLSPRGQIPTLIVRDLKRNALFNFGINVLASFFPRVDYLAHLGGAVGGILLVGSGVCLPTVSCSPELEHRSSSHGWLTQTSAILCGLALLCSLGKALSVGQPWLLVQPLKFERHRLGDTGLSMNIPTLLEAAKSIPRDGDEAEFRFGGNLDVPVTLHVTIAPPDLPTYAPAPSAIPIGAPQQLTIQGLPALLTKYRFGWTNRIEERLFQIRPKYSVDLNLHADTDLPQNLQLDLAALLESLREDSSH